MNKSWMRSGALLAIIAACSGCSREATGQTVAIVNGEEISAAELNAELAAAQLPPNADTKTVLPQLLQRMIDRKLMAQNAVEQNVDRSPEYLNRERRMREELLIGLYTQGQADAIKIPDAKAIDGFIASNPAMFAGREILSLDQIEFAKPADPAVMTRFENDHSLADIERTLASLGLRFTRRNAKIDSATAPAGVLKQINALPPGEPFIITIGDRVFASVVVSRAPVAAEDGQTRKIAAELMERQQLSKAVETQLKSLRGSAEIEYQSGYAPPVTKATTPPAAAKQI